MFLHRSQLPPPSTPKHPSWTLKAAWRDCFMAQRAEAVWRIRARARIGTSAMQSPSPTLKPVRLLRFPPDLQSRIWWLESLLSRKRSVEAARRSSRIKEPAPLARLYPETFRLSFLHPHQCRPNALSSYEFPITRINPAFQPNLIEWWAARATACSQTAERPNRSVRWLWTSR